MFGNRAQTNVIGIVLLVGAVFASAIGIVALGSSVLEAHETGVEAERAEGALITFAQRTDAAVSTGTDPATTAFGRFEHGRVESRTDAGYVRVVHVTDSRETRYEGDLGALVYDDGETEIAYQGGGVWRTDGEGTSLVSAPAVDARNRTLSLSLVRVTGDRFRETAAEPTVQRAAPPTEIAVPDTDRTAGPFANGAVRLEIGSEYCDGWERYLESELDGGVVERCGDGRADRVVVELHSSFGAQGFDSVVIAENVSVHQQAPEIRGDVKTSPASADEELEDAVSGDVSTTGYVYPSADEVVAEKRAACDGEYEPLEARITEPGLHCATELTGDHTVDTTAGDVEIVVRDRIGDPNYVGDLTVDGDRAVTVYTDDAFAVRGNAALGNASDPSQLRLVSASDREITLKGTPTIDALLYAPESSVTVQGNPTVTGSVVADSAEIENINPGRVEYDERMESLTLEPDGPRLEYVDATAYEAAVTD